MMEIKKKFSDDLQKWEAIQNRDKRADGVFVYGVRTTGIYCRPSCASRMPNRENVCFFESAQLAEAGGFRPCKRCSPQRNASQDEKEIIVLKVCRIINEADEEPKLNQIAEMLGFSPSYLHRIFKNVMGITPKQYAMEMRTAKVRKGIREDTSITSAIYKAGFSASSRFYENAAGTLGMKPGQYRRGGEGVTIDFSIVETYLGWTLIAETRKGVCWIGFDDDHDTLLEQLVETFPNAVLKENCESLTQIIAEMIAYIKSPTKACNLPLDIQGTAFQRRVWDTLRTIRSGKTATYKEIAEQIGKPKSYRAVANACTANKLAVVIPCHRVVRGDGGLGGYRWGLARKRALLKKESELKLKDPDK